MKFVSKILVFLFVFCVGFSTAQKNSDKLRKEQERLDKNINNTKSLLNKAKNSTQASLNELKLIDNQVKSREELLLNFDNQIRGA